MTSNKLQGSQVCVVCGPGQSLANRILGRIRNLLEPHGVLFDTAKNYLIINKVEIFSVPSHNLNSLRSLENPKILYITEADFLPFTDFANARECAERYISKSDPWIILESTINSPVGLFAEIFKEQNSLYTKKTINYLDALNEGMYLQKDIDKAKQSRSFAKELLCDIYALGNVTGTFNPQWVEKAFTNNMDIKPVEYSIGIDSGYKPAKFGVSLIGKDANGMHHVITSEEYDEELEDDMVQLIISLKEQFSCRNIFLDSSDKRLCRRLEQYTRDWVDVDAHIAFLKKNGILSPYNKLKDLMQVCPMAYA
jgi:hypothetical protein